MNNGNETTQKSKQSQTKTKTKQSTNKTTQRQKTNTNKNECKDAKRTTKGNVKFFEGNAKQSTKEMLRILMEIHSRIQRDC